MHDYNFSMTIKKTYTSSIGRLFILVAASAVFICCLTGMTAAKLNAAKAALLFAVFVSFCFFFTLYRIKGIKAGFLGLLSGVPAGFISVFALNTAFNSVNRIILVCFGIILRFFLFGCMACIIISCVALIATKRFTTEDAVIAVLAAGFILRVIMVLFTPLNYYQHDVSAFNEEFEGFHDDYIMYIYENWSLPEGDVRDLGQLYHPPLHHILSALFYKLNSIFFPGRINEINTLKTLPFIWSNGFVLFSLGILKKFKIKGTPLVLSLALVSFHPQLIFLAIQVNNDALALMLFTASVYLALKWYEEPKLTTILFTAFAIGCAMMTKLSSGLVAFPVGFLFLCRLITALKKKAKDISVTELFRQFILIGLLVIPLGLWFPTANYLSHKTPFTYIFAIDSTAGQDVWMFPMVKRLFQPSYESLMSPFISFDSTKPGIDYNIFLSLLKTSLFDERRFNSDYLLTVGRILLVIASLIAVIIIVCTVFVIVRMIRQRKMNAGLVSLLLLCITLMVSYIGFCFAYPVVCSESFRYVASVLPAATVFFGLAAQSFWRKLPAKIFFTVTVIVFVCAVFAFYGSYEQYRNVWELLIR